MVTVAKLLSALCRNVKISHVLSRDSIDRNVSELTESFECFCYVVQDRVRVAECLRSFGAFAQYGGQFDERLSTNRDDCVRLFNVARSGLCGA